MIEPQKPDLQNPYERLGSQKKAAQRQPFLFGSFKRP